MDELRVPLDSGGFSRLECPRCHAQFKVRWSAREARLLASALARRYGQAEEPDAGAPRFCAYCACAAPGDAFFTDDVQRRVDLEASKLETEVRSRRLTIPEEWRQANPRAALASPSAGGPRLRARADPDDDLVAIALPCCGEEQKVSDAWLGPIRCHLCGIAHLRAGPRDIGLEMALLREWTKEPDR